MALPQSQLQVPVDEQHQVRERAHPDPDKVGIIMKGEVLNNIVTIASRRISEEQADHEWKRAAAVSVADGVHNMNKMRENVYMISKSKGCIACDGVIDKANTHNQHQLVHNEQESDLNAKNTKSGKKLLKREHNDGKASFCSWIYGQNNGPNNIHLLLAEFIGTALLLFLGCMGCITNYEIISVPHYMPALSFGLTVMIIIQMFGHISGAHLNPAVTMVTAINGIVELKSVPFYLLGQFAGAIFGLGGLKLLVPQDYIAQEVFDEKLNVTIRKPGLCTTNIHSGISSMQGLVIEIVITFVLIFVCCAIWDKRNATKQDSVPLRFGLIISSIAIAAGPFSGGSMNTARSFAPALLNGDWENQWIYWIGPTVGGLIAAYLYKFIYAVPDTTEEAEEYEEVSMKSMNKNDAKV